MKPAKPAPTPLTENQLLVARWFAMMDDRRQREAMRYMADIAVAFPRCTEPALHIVKGGGK
ncbi:hypothetical protein [Rugamonas sp.]|uniref:hypothetical protein n=1 Tax=Rugamonas sp. TaxID=1926287 RepID=UPI0025F133C7|nr:hypothetical protein [Rugamonas sp.]